MKLLANTRLQRTGVDSAWLCRRRCPPAAEPPSRSPAWARCQRAMAMGERPHAVALVVDPEFGERLADLSRRIHVWGLVRPPIEGLQSVCGARLAGSTRSRAGSPLSRRALM